MKNNEEVKKIDEEQLEEDWRDRGKITDAYVEFRNEFFGVESDLASMWDETFGRMNVRRHRVELSVANSKRIHSALYQKSTNENQFENKNSKRFYWKKVLRWLRPIG